MRAESCSRRRHRRSTAGDATAEEFRKSLTQTGAALSGFIGGLAANGTVLDESSWLMVSTPSCEAGCCAKVTLRAENQRGGSADGALTIAVDCATSDCSIRYVGPLTR